MNNSIERIALKTALIISKQKLCLLKPFCDNLVLECTGVRLPWCSLEIELKKDNSKAFNVKSEKIIKLLLQINEGLENKIVTPLIKGSLTFICPFLKENLKPCFLKICPYNSMLVENTNCTLSTGGLTSLSDLAIMKNLNKRQLLKIIFSIESGKKWETVSDLLKVGIKRIASCPNCGNFLSACHNNLNHCNRREALNLSEETLVPERFLSKYPLILIILVTKKIFGSWSDSLYSKKVLNLYKIDPHIIK